MKVENVDIAHPWLRRVTYSGCGCIGFCVEPQLQPVTEYQILICWRYARQEVEDLLGSNGRGIYKEISEQSFRHEVSFETPMGVYVTPVL